MSYSPTTPTLKVRVHTVVEITALLVEVTKLNRFQRRQIAEIHVISVGEGVTTDLQRLQLRQPADVHIEVFVISAWAVIFRTCEAVITDFNTLQFGKVINVHTGGTAEAVVSDHKSGQVWVITQVELIDIVTRVVRNDQFGD